MQVILQENIRKLGKLGDKVEVKPGYGRNYLIPQKKAVFATSENIAQFEQRRAALEEKAQQLYTEAEKRAEKLSGHNLTIRAQASEEGKLFGSVGVNEINQALVAQSIEVAKREIVMPEGPIHSVGDYVVEIHVHSDIIANLKVQIVPVK